MQRSRSPVVAFAWIAVALAGCSSSPSKAAAPTSTSSSSANPSAAAPTGDPDQQLNSIPYNVGEPVGLPNGWKIQVTRVHRPYEAARLPSLPAGQQYVGVDLTMTNNAEAPVTVHARRIFTLTEGSGRSDAVISGAVGATGLDGVYESGARRSGRLVFSVTLAQRLQMFLDGPAIGTQRSVFQIDPPTVPPID